LGISRRFGNDSLLEYLCMYMRVVVSSGSSIRILYPRECYDFWVNPEGPIRTVCQSTTCVVSPRPSPIANHVLKEIVIIGW
jgi:hypothetical protein